MTKKHQDHGPRAGDEGSEAARRKFIEDVKERGEVVPEGEDLPPGATHELAEGEKDGDEPTLHRRRFSTY